MTSNAFPEVRRSLLSPFKTVVATCLVALATAPMALAQSVDISGKWYGRLNVVVDEKAIREKAGEDLNEKMIASLRSRVQQSKKMLVILTINKDGSYSAMTKNAPKGTTPVTSGKWTMKGNDILLKSYKAESQILTINTKTASLISTLKGGAITVTTVYTRR